MKKSLISNILVLVGVILYNYFFWGEKFGINLLLFTVFITGSLFYLNPESRFSTVARLTAVGTLFAAVMVVVQNSGTSRVVHLLSMLVMVGFIQQRELRFLWYGFALGFVNIFEVPSNAIKQFSNFGGRFSGGRTFWRYFKLAWIPLLILPVFYGIYYVANPKFASLSDDFWGNMNIWLFSWITNISFERFLFLLLGFFLVGGALWNSTFKALAEKQSQKVLTLYRKRIRRPYKVHFSSIALKNEYRIALILVGALNLLLLIVNITDIGYVWIGFDKESPGELKTFVHEGTYLLIFAILMAMAIVMYFFRRNINFLTNNIWLKRLAYFWIIQNIVLTLSVAMRNYHYIDFHGLAYKRIGVFFFLILTLYGLFTMLLKVRDKRTTYFLLRNNSWALYLVGLMMTSVNWDNFITKYNLNAETRSSIDVPFLLHDISDINLALLYENKEKLPTKDSYPYYTEAEIMNGLASKKEHFINKQKKYSWLSWNLPDQRNMKYLKEKGLLEE